MLDQRSQRRPWLLYAISAVLVLMVLSPIATVFAGSFLNTAFLGLSSEQWVRESGNDTTNIFTFKWFGYVLQLYRPQLVFGVQLAIANVAVCLVIGIPGAYALVRDRVPGCGLLEDLLMLPLTLPGLTIAIGLLQAYSLIRGKWWLILAGQLLYTMPFMVRSITGALRSYDHASMERASRSLGAGFWQTAWHVTLPNVRHAVVVGSLLVFAISWGEFNVSFLLNTPLFQGFPAALYATYTHNSFQVSSAATVLFLMVIIPVLLVIQAIGGREMGKIEQAA